MSAILDWLSQPIDREFVVLVVAILIAVVMIGRRS